jgi:hypothetical protein
MRHNKLGMSQPSVLHDIDLACQNDERTGRDFAGCDEALARREKFAFTEPRQAIDFRRIQHGKHLIASGFDERMERMRHGFL